MANIIGTNGNDTLVGSKDGDTINGLAGNDTIISNLGFDRLTGGSGNDKFVYSLDNLNYPTSTITDFGGVGKGTKPTAAVIAKVDTIKFQDAGATAKNLLLTQNGSNLEITFSKKGSPKVILQNFALENLDNLSLSTGASVDLGNIEFNGQTSITDSFDVFNANSTQNTIFNKNTVTFLNDLNNNVNGFDNSDDVINGQGGNDIINGKSGNDLLRGGAGNDTLIGGAGNDTLIGDAGDHSLNYEFSSGDNLLSGGDGNDSISVYFNYNYQPWSQNNTLNGGAGNDNLNVMLSGGDGNDFLDLSAVPARTPFFYNYYYYYDPSSNKNTLNGGAGDDTLSTSGVSGDNLLYGGDGNDSLFASDAFGYNTLNGGNGDDTLTGNCTLTGGGGKDKFVYNLDHFYNSQTSTITDFGGVSKGTNPTAEVIAEVDTLNFQGDGFTAQNLLLTQNGNNLEITFQREYFKREYYYETSGKVILENFKLENLDNLNLSTGATVDLGNIEFNGQTSITDSFDVFNANSTQSTIFNKNTVTFLNDLDNNVNGFDNSNDVINGEGGDDIINGLSGNDLLRGGAGNNTLNGGAGDDTLNVDSLLGNNLLSGGDGNDSLFASGYQYYFAPALEERELEGDLRTLGNNTLNGGAGNDTLSASGSKGDNLVSGGDGNDSLSVSGDNKYRSDNFEIGSDIRSYGNNTLNGGAGDDTLSASGSFGDNLLSGGDGNDSLSVSGFDNYYNDDPTDSRSKGNNTLNGGAGDDTLDARGSTGDNLLSGGDGNDFLFASDALGNNILDGGNGNDTLSGFYGNNRIIGGAGNDTFAFNYYYNLGVATIYDFDAKNELIQISATDFGGELSIGSLKTSQFTLGTSATTSNQRFIYNSATGGLFFDLDGSGGAFTQIKFAQLSSGLSLTEKNFVIVS